MVARTVYPPSDPLACEGLYVEEERTLSEQSAMTPEGWTHADETRSSKQFESLRIEHIVAQLSGSKRLLNDPSAQHFQGVSHFQLLLVCRSRGIMRGYRHY